MLKGNKIFEDLLLNNKVNYTLLRESAFSKIYESNINYDINMIVPINGRVDFLNPLYKSFIIAKEKSNLKISLTIVEMSKNSNQKEFCINNKINYIFIESDIFNKCLAMNFGALFSIKSKSFIFHDLDCLLDNDFFNKLYKNKKSKELKVLQCFPDRRLFYLNDELTESVINCKLNTNDLLPETEGVLLDPTEIAQAPGGSIYIERDIFFEVGGYDPEFFYEHSPEDAFFWEKIELLGEKIGSCDNPRINLYHMSHEKNTNSLNSECYSTYERFYHSDNNHKLDILLQKKNIIRDFYSDSNITNVLESIIMDKFFSKITDVINVVDIPKKVINTVPVNIIQKKTNCSCGSKIDRMATNFCQRCGKIY